MAEDADNKQVETEPKAPKKVAFFRLKALVALPLIFAVAFGAFVLLVDGVLADHIAESATLIAGEDGEAEVGAVKLNIFGPSIEIGELRAWQDEDGKEREVLYVKSAKLDIEFLPLLERRLVVNEVSAAEVRWNPPKSKEEPKDRESAMPLDANQIGQYVLKAKEVIESDDLQEVLDWVEKIKEYKEERDAAGDDEEEAEEKEIGPGPSGRAGYVEKALTRTGTPPRVIFRKASLSELAITFGAERKKRFVRKITDLELVAQEVSSDPVLYGKPVTFKASGKLDGDADREAAISLDLNFDPNTLLSVEQVGASASLKSLSLKGLLDPAIFGDTLTEATITFENFAPEHTELPGRTLLKISGAVLPPGAEQPVEARVDIWFGGHGGGAAAPFAPSGIGASVQNVPLDPLLKQLGAEGMPKIRPGARISLGTSDAAGSFDTPQAALTWHDGVRVHVRAVIDNLAFAQPKGGTVGGLPADSLASALNRLMTAMKNRLEVQVGFVGAPGEFELALERPGLRNVLDAAIGVLELNGQEMNAEFDLPFTIDVKATATCASVDAEGRPRGIEGEPSSSLADLRLRVSLAKAYAVKKKGHEKILGVPADYFTFAWNMLVAKLPDETIDLTIRLVDEKGRFSPTLVGPDGKQLLKLLGDAVGIDIFEKNFEQLKQKFDAEFKEFQKGGISKAEELGTKLAKGERIKPEEIIPDLPKLPEKPPIKLPKKPPIKLPKFP